MGVLIITHYQRILHMVIPQFVHIMFDGRIVKEGGPGSSPSSRSTGTAGSATRSPQGPRMSLTVPASASSPCSSARARLPRLRGDVADAAGVIEAMDRATARRARPCTARRTRSPPRRRRCSRGRARAWPRSPARRRARPSSPATRPRRSTSSRGRGAARTCPPATGSPSPRWSTTRTSSRGRWSPQIGRAARLRRRHRRRPARPRLARRGARARAEGARGRARVERARHDQSLERSPAARTTPARSSVVDGAQAVPHLPVDVAALGVDFYAWTGHKAYGPTGIGVLHGRMELLEAMPPWLGGGHMIKRVGRDESTYVEPPARFEAGTSAVAEGIGSVPPSTSFPRSGWTRCASTAARSPPTRLSASASSTT